MKKVLKIAAVLALMLVLCACAVVGPTEIETCNHRYVSEITFKATCVEAGVKTFTCNACGDFYTEPIPQLEHNFTSTTHTSPTCTAEGEQRLTCKDCGHFESRPIPKIEHNYSATVTTPSTCTAEGVRTHTCDGCGHSYTEPIRKLNHSYTSKVTTKATCTTEGVKTYTCNDCGDSYTEATPLAEHNYTSKVTTKATCTAEGVKTHTCKDCGHNYTESIKKADHNYSSKVTTAATCTAEGVKTYTCNDCGHNYTESIKKIDHNYTSKVTTEATCTKEGVKTYTCSSCGKTYTETIKALGHNPDKDLICTRCGEKCPVVLDMTSSEKKNAEKIEWIGDRQVWHQDDNGRYVLVFALKDDDKKMMYAPAVVEIKIVNDAGETVYTATKILRKDNFQYWYYNNGSTEKYQATIFINDDEIKASAKSSSGKIYFTVYNKGYFSFSESTLDISDLPEKSADGKPIKWYKEGTYKVGTDIPAGEYYIKCTSSSMCYFAIKSGSKILENENFNGWHFVTVRNGEYLEVNRGKFCAVSSALLEVDLQNIPEGMYRVGIDIPAGEYKLTSNSSSMGYLCVYDNSSADRKIITNDNFNGNQYVTVKAGQYLQIVRCDGKLVSEIKEPDPTEGGGSGGGSGSGGNSSNPEENLWSFTDASNLNKNAEKATKTMNTASQYVIDYYSAGAATKAVYLKSAVTTVKTAQNYLKYMKELADNRATLTLKNSNYATLQEMITATYERCNNITSLEITSSNHSEYFDYVRDEVMSIYTACLGIQNLSVEIMKAFVE